MGDRDGCLCIGCLEKRIGRMTPADFPDHPFKVLPGTPRLLESQGATIRSVTSPADSSSQPCKY
jgi:hypothetical protein